MKRDVQVDFGKFASNSATRPTTRRQITTSRAYLFNFLPFYHSGVKTIPVNDKITFFYALTNGLQQTEDFNNFAEVGRHHQAQREDHIIPLLAERICAAGRGTLSGNTHVAHAAATDASIGVDVNHVTNEVTKDSDAGALTGLGAYLRYAS
jgi:hypothetical protein